MPIASEVGVEGFSSGNAAAVMVASALLMLLSIPVIGRRGVYT